MQRRKLGPKYCVVREQFFWRSEIDSKYKTVKKGVDGLFRPSEANSIATKVVNRIISAQKNIAKDPK